MVVVTVEEGAEDASGEEGEGSSRPYWRRRPTALVVTWVRWKGGMVHTNPISVH